jgi:CBS domain-containing protein
MELSKVEQYWALPVRDFMSKGLISVALDTPLDQVQRTLEDQEISAVPVLDEEGGLRGILSSKDLLHAARLEMTSPEEIARVVLPRRTASDLMRSAVLTVDDQTAVGRAGAEMLRHRVHRLIVVCDGRPSAVISTRDAMRAIAMARVKTPLAEVMTTEVETIEMDLAVDAAIERLDDANVRGLIVTDGAWPIGVFTHTEAIRARALPPSMRKIPVERVMSYEIICLDTLTPIDRVANYARQMRVRRILAVENGRVKGIATGFDLLRIMAF